MALQPKDLVKLNQIIGRIQAGRFDSNDVDNLLIRLRPYAGMNNVFLEVTNFVAHSDARDRGLAQQTITAFVDSIRFFREYVSENRTVDLTVPFPAYIHRLFLSQVRLADERRLRAEYRMSRATLKKKIEANFLLDKKTGTCTLRDNKGGAEFLAALEFITSFIHSRAAFHVQDFHKELKDVMHGQRITFDETMWNAQLDRISLALLCLVSNTEFVLMDGSRASCRLETKNHFRLLSGHYRLPNGDMSPEPTSFGCLMILGETTVNSANMAPVRVNFPLIDTDLDPHQHCDPRLFAQERAPEDFGDCEVETIVFARDMSLSNDFKLVRSDSLI